MACGNRNGVAMTSIVRQLALLALTLSSLLVAPAAFAVDSGDIVIVSVKGEINVTMNGKVREVRAGSVLELPATLRTGPDGAVEIKQGATTVSIGPETLLEFPALEKRGAPIDRIIQSSGKAFYNIGKREGRKLRVETPYLVGTIRGTQFNVVVQDGAATISLFEGLLDVRSTDDSEAVDLKAGEIASRKRGDKAIGVMKMDGMKAPPTGARPSASTSTLSAESNLAADAPSDNDMLMDASADAGSRISVTAPPAQVDLGADVTVDPPVGTVDLSVTVGGVDLGLDVDLRIEDDDGNNGHGNDADGHDSSNPGHGSDKKGRGN